MLGSIAHDFLNTVPIGQGQQKIECRNFRKFIFSKKNLILGKKNIGEYSTNKHLPNLIFPKKIIIQHPYANPTLLVQYVTL